MAAKFKPMTNHGKLYKNEMLYAHKNLLHRSFISAIFFVNSKALMQFQKNKFYMHEIPL